MQLVVVSDIFGKTPELEDLVNNIATNFASTLLVDPYEGDLMNFGNEQAAYSYFNQKIGLDDYTATVLEKLKQRDIQLLLVGFSIGASVIWKISQEKIFHPHTKAIGFYGSQIRNLLDVNPGIHIDLYLPRYEPHFEVSEFIEEVTKKKFARCVKTGYLHGFMNKRSKNYNRNGYSEYLTLLRKEAERFAL
jgi:dienelactone hydrolase